MNPIPELPAPSYEPSDANVRFVLVNVGAVALGIALSLAIAAWLYRGVDPAARPSGPERSFRHGAVDESGIARDWRAQDAAVRGHLENYAWADRGAGIVRIPLERAMDLMARDASAEPEKSR